MTHDYKTDAQDLWNSKKRYGRDRPTISVWMPSEQPHCRLETIANGCGEADTLPDGPAKAYVNISGVSIGGYLDDLELLFDVVCEQLENVRSYYCKLKDLEADK